MAFTAPNAPNVCAGRRRSDRRRGRLPSSRRPRRDADRDGLWPRGRCDLGRRRRGDLRGQGTADVQSAHRPCPRHRGRAARGRILTPGGKARGGLLAGPADARRAGRRRTVGSVALARAGSRQRRDARAAPRGGARADRSAAARRSSPLRPTARAASARRPPSMFWPISMGGSTSFSTRGPSRHGLESTIVACLGGPDRRCCGPARLRARRSRGSFRRRLPFGTKRARRPMRRAARFALCAARPASARGAQSGERRGRARFCWGARGQRGGRASRSVAVRRLIEAAANLFAYLRALDETGATAHSRRSRSPQRPRRGDQRPAAPRRRPQNAPRLRDTLDFDARNCRIAAMSEKMTIDGPQPATRA